jgi:hypothetical protein
MAARLACSSATCLSILFSWEDMPEETQPQVGSGATSHRRPEKPAGQRHWKDPGVFMH